MGIRTLLVEDNPADVFLLCKALQQNGITLDLYVAEDGDIAIQHRNEVDFSFISSPELIIVDLNLPRVTGFEVVTRVRASPRCGSVPVAVLTSSDSPTDRREAARRGASAYLLKATEVSELAKIGADLKDLLGH
jgi:chemotaxis family two-component system response regulator Rcp1